VVVAPGLLVDEPGDEGGQLLGGPDRRCPAGIDDGPSDATGPRLLAVAPEEGRQLSGIESREELGRGDCSEELPAWPAKFDYWNEGMRDPAASADISCWAKAALAVAH